MAEWKALADTVLITLLSIDTTKTPDIFQVLSGAHLKLTRWIRIAIQVRRGFVVTDNDNDIPHPAPDGSCPTVGLELARRLFVQLCEAHDAAGNVFVLCRTRLGGTVPSDPLWPAWERQRAVVLHHAARVREALRSAASHADAANWTGQIAAMYALSSPGRTAWSSAHLNLARRASWGTLTAVRALFCMRDAVASERQYAHKILHRSALTTRCEIEGLRASR